MATADFDRASLASPLAYNASQTALILADYHNFVIERCGEKGAATVAKAQQLREWALKNNIIVLHALVDADQNPPSTAKGGVRLAGMLEAIRSNKSGLAEPPELTPSSETGPQEYIIRKRPGVVSALKSAGAMELLREKGIKSLILAGLSSSGVVLSTTKEGTDEMFVMTIIKDACADPKEDIHKVMMETILPHHANAAETEEFLTAWNSA